MAEKMIVLETEISYGLQNHRPAAFGASRKNNSDVKIMDILGCDGTELPIVDSA